MEIEIIDNSGDKKYFTIVPNYILNHSTADEQALYAQMKKFAGETGKCFATIETLSEKLFWNEHKVRGNIEKLLKREWIKKVGTVAGKTHPVNAYEVVDLWDLNTKYYQGKKGASTDAIFNEVKRREPLRTVRREPLRTAEEEKKEEELLTNVSKGKALSISKPTISITKPRRDIEIIKIWIEEMKLKPENKIEYGQIIRRNIRVAQSLVGYSDGDIRKTISILKDTDYLKKFTLETVGKYIDEVKSGGFKSPKEVLNAMYPNKIPK